MAWIIVKYAQDNYPSGKAPAGAGCHNTWTSRELDLQSWPYDTKEEAETDLPKMQKANPSVYYGICEVEE